MTDKFSTHYQIGSGDDIYPAPKPHSTLGNFAKKIAPRIFFPPLILIDGLRFCVNKAFGSILSKQILPAQTKKFARVNDKFKAELLALNQSKVLQSKSIKVKTYDGAELDTLEIRNKKQQSLPSNQQQYIIHFMGNASCYAEFLKDMQDDANRLKCNVIGFNYRGVFNSKGKAKSANDLVTDGIAEVQRLLDCGVSPKNIILKGFSLGGGISTLVAKHFYDQGITINLFNSRSYSSITNVVVGRFETAYESKTPKAYPETLIRKVLGTLMKPIVKFALYLTEWDIPAGKAYQKLPEGHKDYIVVRSSKAERKDKTTVIDDAVIPHSASLHMALQKERRKEKAQIDKALHQLPATSTYASLRNKLEASRDHLKERKMVADKDVINPHRAHLDQLHDRLHMKTANDFFAKFFDQVQRENREEEKSSIMQSQHAIIP